jgi:hypothetical protein
MAGVGRFKMTDALPPEERVKAEPSTSRGDSQPGATNRAGQGKRKGKGKARGKPDQTTSRSLDAEQVREARESAQARNAEAGARDRMVDIGRGNQQAGRQRAK